MIGGSDLLKNTLSGLDHPRRLRSANRVRHGARAFAKESRVLHWSVLWRRCLTAFLFSERSIRSRRSPGGLPLAVVPHPCEGSQRCPVVLCLLRLLCFFTMLHLLALLLLLFFVLLFVLLGLLAKAAAARQYGSTANPEPSGCKRTWTNEEQAFVPSWR